MGFTLIGYSESQDTSGALTEHAAIADTHVNVSGDNIRVPSFATKLFGYHVMGASTTLAQLSSPSLRAKNLIDISPVDLADEPASPSAVHLITDRPVQLQASEDLQFLAAEGGAGAVRTSAYVLLGEQIDAVPSGEIRTVRFTTTGTLTANAFSTVTLTGSQQLEAGRYAIVGARVTSTGGRFARFIIPGSAHRPGCPAYDALSDLEVSAFRKGGLGVWGEFEHVELPQCEVFSASADSDVVVFLDLIKVA